MFPVNSIVNVLVQQKKNIRELFASNLEATVWERLFFIPTRLCPCVQSPETSLWEVHKWLAQGPDLNPTKQFLHQLECQLQARSSSSTSKMFFWLNRYKFPQSHSKILWKAFLKKEGEDNSIMYVILELDVQQAQIGTMVMSPQTFKI